MLCLALTPGLYNTPSPAQRVALCKWRRGWEGHQILVKPFLRRYSDAPGPMLPLAQVHAEPALLPHGSGLPGASTSKLMRWLAMV